MLQGIANNIWIEYSIWKKIEGFLARATEGTSLYVWVRQSVSQLVSAFLFLGDVARRRAT